MQSINNRKMHRQAGLTMIELAIAVVLSAIIAAGAILVYNSVSANNKLTTAEQDLAQVKTNTEQLYAGQPGFGTLSNTIAFNANVFPTQMATSATNVLTPWTGAVTLAVDTNTSLFDITYAAVPQDACIKLASYGFGQWTSLTINGTAVAQTSGTDAVGIASGACTAGNTNAMVWVTN